MKKNFFKKVILTSAFVFIITSENYKVMANDLCKTKSSELITNNMTSDTLNDNVINSMNPEIAHEAVEKIDLLKKMYPHITDSDLNIFLINYLNNNYSTVNNYQLKSFGLPYENRLNEKEKELFNSNVLKGVRALNYAYNSKVRAEARFVSSSLYQGNGDAFRHCLWNALMTKDLGASYAKQWGDAHEYGQSGIDTEMDLCNNSMGRRIVNSIDGAMNSPYWQPRLEAEIINNIDNGNLKIIVNNRLVWSNSSGKKYE